MEPYLDHPAPPAALAEPGGTLAKPLWNPRGTYLNPQTTPQPYLTSTTRTTPPEKLSLTPQPLWNPGGNLVEPGGTLVEPYLSRTDHPAALAEPLVEPDLNHPGPPRRTWWNSGGTLTPNHPARTWQNPDGGTLVGGTLVEPYLKPPRTTPDHPALTEPGGALVEPYLNLVEPW